MCTNPSDLFSGVSRPSCRRCLPGRLPAGFHAAVRCPTRWLFLCPEFQVFRFYFKFSENFFMCTNLSNLFPALAGLHAGVACPAACRLAFMQRFAAQLVGFFYVPNFKSFVFILNFQKKIFYVHKFCNQAASRR